MVVYKKNLFLRSEIRVGDIVQLLYLVYKTTNNYFRSEGVPYILALVLKKERMCSPRNLGEEINLSYNKQDRTSSVQHTSLMSISEQERKNQSLKMSHITEQVCKTIGRKTEEYISYIENLKWFPECPTCL
jgi:hypothetical protein